MRVPLSWLCDFAPIDLPADEVWAALDGIGLTVDGVERIGEGLDDIVVATVLATRPHPDADRIQLVEVDAGDGEPLQIACGAFNFGPGDKVPLAPVGATLPGGLEIGRRKMRGEWSNGMLCSATELGLGGDSKGIMLLAPEAQAGVPLREALGLASDVVFDVDVTANRPDAMSIAGVARDLAAHLRVPFELPSTSVSDAPFRVENLASIEVRAPELCPRFTVRVLEGVTPGPSPQWMQRRLALAGMRPINLAVDASNYVMLEMGHPTHPYDLDRLAGEGLIVREARAGELVTTLDGVERRTGEAPAGETGDCLICDAENEPVGVAGIMGGAGSGITEETSRVLLETAYFEPMAIARTSKRLRLRSEASARFERGVDPEGLDFAADRYCTLVGATVAAGRLDARAAPPQERRARIRVARTNLILGTNLTAADIAGYLDPLGFSTAPADTGEDELEARLPSWRPDATGEIDLIEEVARHHGYEALGRTPLTGARVGGLSPYQRERRRVRELMTAMGVSEASTSPLVGPDDNERSGWNAPVLKAANPMVREESVFRATLLPGLLRALSYNAGHRLAGVALFELGKVFRVPEASGQELPLETERLTAVLAGQNAEEAVRLWRGLARHLRIAGTTLRAEACAGLHPYRSAAIALATGAPVGSIGEVHPGVLQAWGLEGPVAVVDLDLEVLWSAPRRPLEQQPVSRFPSADIDLAFAVPDSVSAAEVAATIADSGGSELVSLELFDVYRGEQVPAGSRGLAYRLRFQAPDRTLTDADVAARRNRIIASVTESHGAALR